MYSSESRFASQNRYLINSTSRFRISAYRRYYRKNSAATGMADLAGQPDDGSMKSNCESTKAQIGPHLLGSRCGRATCNIALSGSPAEAFFRSQLLAF